MSGGVNFGEGDRRRRRFKLGDCTGDTVSLLFDVEGSLLLLLTLEEVLFVEGSLLLLLTLEEVFFVEVVVLDDDRP